MHCWLYYTQLTLSLTTFPRHPQAPIFLLLFPVLATLQIPTFALCVLTTKSFPYPLWNVQLSYLNLKLNLCLNILKISSSAKMNVILSAPDKTNKLWPLKLWGGSLFTADKMRTWLKCFYPANKLNALHAFLNWIVFPFQKLIQVFLSYSKQVALLHWLT